MTSKIGSIVGKVNEAVGAMKANANHTSVREDGVKQEALGKKQQADSTDVKSLTMTDGCLQWASINRDLLLSRYQPNADQTSHQSLQERRGRVPRR